MQAFSNPNATMISHEEAGSRLRISAILELEQPLHVGSGRGTTQTDSAVTKDHNGEPIIPGSSLRGALRSRCERLADALLPGQICFLYEEGSTVECVSVDKDLLRTNNGDLLEDAAIWAKLPTVLCPSCRVFGASGYWASKVRIPDLSMRSVSDNKSVTDVRHGVGIHRDTQTAAPAIKYDQEIVLRNAQFDLEIIVENPDADDLSLLALGLADLASGRMALGGNTSRGLGGCTLTEAMVETVDLSKPAELIAYLANDKYPTSQPLSEWLSAQLKRWTEA